MRLAYLPRNIGVTLEAYCMAELSPDPDAKATYLYLNKHAGKDSLKS